MAKLVEFITKQSESEINIEEAFKPEPNHNGFVVVLSVLLVLGFLLGTKTLTAQSIYQNVYLWGTAILVIKICFAYLIFLLGIHNCNVIWTHVGKDS